MQYEPSTSDCHVFIKYKEQIEEILLRLYKLDNAEYVCDQLESVHQQI